MSPLTYKAGDSLETFALRKAITELDPYESMWNKYSKRITKKVELRQADFSGLLFKNARFTNHNFIDCDFRGSRWIFSHMEKCNCTGSDFSGASFLLYPFINTDCTNCNFTDVEISFFSPFEKNNYKNANFTNAKLNTSHSFFTDKELPSPVSFKNTIMNGCELIISKEKLPEHNTSKSKIKSILESIFSPEQQAVMKIRYTDYQDEENKEKSSSGCFIATAACGIASDEVIILRNFRDTVLQNIALGRLFIRTYYRLSPPIASLIANSPKAKCLVRNMLVRPWARLANLLIPR
jgi:uncharacterized protein YjbI with pentapeptide repeats